VHKEKVHSLYENSKNHAKGIFMKLYKFRPLGCGKDKWVADILENRTFRCSKFLQLNDPMEGVFSTTMNEAEIESIFELKCKYRICSFSGKNAFGNPLMWGYYANGFKGVAIEIEVIDDVAKKYCVEYVPAALTIEKPSQENVERILRTKLDIWKHEEEYRFLTGSEDDPREQEIGKITAIYFGNPYGNVINKEACQGEPSHLSYKEAKESIIGTVRTENKKTGNAEIVCYDVEIINGQVEIGAKIE
jgi:hypothetical protein